MNRIARRHFVPDIEREADIDIVDAVVLDDDTGVALRAGGAEENGLPVSGTCQAVIHVVNVIGFDPNTRRTVFQVDTVRTAGLAAANIVNAVVTHGAVVREDADAGAIVDKAG